MSVLRKDSVGGKLGRINRYKNNADADELLLDKYPGAGIALSLKRLSSIYPGSCIRVRRSLDNDELDIGFAGYELDVSSLLSFVRNSSGFVTKIYGQEGKNRDFLQPNISRQPKIVNEGSLITRNNKPSIRFLNSSLNCTINTGEIISKERETSIFSCFSTVPKEAAFFGTSYSSSSVIGLYVPWSDGVTYYENRDTVPVRLAWDSFSIGSFLRNKSKIFINKNNVNHLTSLNNPSFPPLTEPIGLGAYPDGANPIDGYISEFIAYNFYLSNHEDLVSELNSYYQIY